MQIIYLDISNKGVVPTVYAKHGDVGRKFEVVLTDFGVPYYPPNGSAFSVWYSGSSGEGNYTDIDDRSAFSVNENKVAVEMISQMLTNDGNGVLCLVLNESNGNQIGSWNIPYICEKIPGFDSEEAKSYYTAFSNAVKDLPYPDASLSTPGKAADSKAVGMALNGKAPAGFGLGVAQTVEWGNIDSITTNGWYRTVVNGEIAPSAATYMAWIRVDALDANYACQTAYITSGDYILQRQLRGGVWSQWCWVNPPMHAGVEYRTTELFKGKAVYTKLFSCGTLAVGSTNVIDTTSSEVKEIVGYRGMIGASALPFMENGCYLRVGNTNGQLTAVINGGSLAPLAETVYAQAWYTKEG